MGVLASAADIFKKGAFWTSWPEVVGSVGKSCFSRGTGRELAAVG